MERRRIARLPMCVPPPLAALIAWMLFVAGGGSRSRVSAA